MEQGPDVGWDLAVVRGKKLAMAEAKVLQLSSKLRLVEKQLERANIMVATIGASLVPDWLSSGSGMGI